MTINFKSLALLISFLSYSVSHADSKNLEGSWQGVLKAQNIELRIVFNFTVSDDGTLKATMDSADQGAKGISVSKVHFENDHLRLEIASIGGTFEGRYLKDEPALDGYWQQGGASFPLVLKPLKNEPKPSSTSSQVVSAADRKKIVGDWMGTLDISNGMKLRVVIHISETETQTLQSTMDSPDQGATDILVSEISFKDDVLNLVVKSVGGRFQGDFKEGEIHGKWSQGGMTLPLDFKRLDEPVEINRPQNPKEPYPYLEEEVEYSNEKAGIKLAGTLTMPKSEAPFPTVLLISGSGPQDRDETVFAHKPFWVIADYLTRQGIAVFRVDDRGVAKSTGSFRDATTENFAEDVLAGVRYLKTRKEINPKLIGLIGHSEGGLIAPMVVTKSPEVAFIVLLAGPALPGEEILLMQGELISRANGASEDLISYGTQYSKRIYEMVKLEQDNKAAEAKIREYHATFWASLSVELKEEFKAIAGDSARIVEGNIKQILTPWFRYFLTYDPRPALKKVKCPVFALNGEKDLQVPPKENLQAMELALKAGGNKQYTLKELPGLNHLFQHAVTGALSEYAKIEETFAPEALALIANWIKNQSENN